MSGTKQISNQTQKPLEITLIIRDGDNPANTWGDQIVRLAPGESREITYGNANNVVYLNGLGLRSGGVFQEQRVETRGDKYDNILNTNSKLTITALPGESVNGSN